MFTMKNSLVLLGGVGLVGALLTGGLAWSQEGKAFAKPKQSRQSIEKGKIFFARNCASCHSGRGCMMVPSLVGVTQRMSDKEIVSHARSLAKRMCCARHLAYLSDGQYRDIVAYLHTLKPGANQNKNTSASRRGCCGGR